MSGLIEKIHHSLKETTQEWDWEFAYAPKPGQQRIKITAISKEDPSRRKVLVLAEDLFKKLPLQNLTSNIVRLLPTLPENNSGEIASARRDPVRPMVPVEKTCSAREQYQFMRRVYQDTVADMRGNARSNGHRLWANAVGRGFQRMVIHFARKTV